MRSIRVILGIIGLFALTVAAAAGDNINLLENPRFDDGGVAQAPAKWKVVNRSGDKLKCASGRAAPAAHSAPCMFMFKGGPTPTTLKQKASAEMLDLANSLFNCARGSLWPSVRVYMKNQVNLRQTLKVRYWSQFATVTVKLSEPLMPVLNTWAHVGTSGLPLGADPYLEKVVYELRHTGSGKVYVDSAAVELNIVANICS